MSANDPAGVESTGPTRVDPHPTNHTQGDTDSEWAGPFREDDKYGEPTGTWYLRCRVCAVEVVTSGRKHATHREGCPHR